MSQLEKVLSTLEEQIDIDYVIETESLHKKSFRGIRIQPHRQAH